MKFLKSRKGMTVVEIVVALGILGLVSVGFMGFFTDSFKFQARNQQSVSIQKIADQTMEKLKINGGKNVTIGSDTLDISGMVAGELQTLSDDDYEYKITVNSIKNINSGTTFYDITVNVISKDNSSIAGSVNSTVQIFDTIVDEDNDGIADENNPIYIRYYSDDILVKEDRFYNGTYLVTSYVPSKQGCIFDNWIDEDDFTYNAGHEIDFDVEIVSDNVLNLYAQWREVVTSKEYTITYNANGGSGSMVSQIVEDGESVTLTANSFTRSGYTFLGWSENNNATTETYANRQTITPTANMTLYAVWKEEEKLLSDVATVGAYVTYVPSSTSYTVPTTVSGYDSEQNFNPANTTSWRVFSVDGENIEIISADSTESLCLYGQTGYINAVQTLQDMSKAFVNSEYATNARSLGYSEDGLTDIANYRVIDTTTYPLKYGVSGLPYDVFPYADDQYDKDEAILDNNYMHTYSWLASRCVYTLSGASRFGLLDVESDGSYVQRYLYVINSDGSIINSSWAYGIRPIVTLGSGLAVYGGSGTEDDPYIINTTNPSQYTVTYNANGGYGEMMPQSVSQGSSVTLTTNAYKHHGNYEFKGWSTGATATSAVYINRQSIKPTADMTLYAVWEEKVVEPATLATGSGWYKGTTGKTTITEINIVDSYAPSTTPTESWAADDDGSGDIMCYVEGTKLTIAGNGTGKILANKDSSYLFGDTTAGDGDEFSSVTNINGLTLLDTSNVTSMGEMFFYCNSLTAVDVSSFNTSKVTDMSRMFSCCYSLTNVNVSNFNTSAVTTMSDMFFECSNLRSLDVSNFDTSQVTSIAKMFDGCSSLTSIDISNFDTSNVTMMQAMFRGCTGLTNLNLSNFDTSNVTNMSRMFTWCKALTNLDISSFDTSNVTNMSEMFLDCQSLISLDLSNFDTSQLVYLYVDVDNIDGINDMFGNMNKLEEITIGEKFSFTDGTETCTLPTPSSEYIDDADGNWYTEDGTAYTPEELAEETRTTATTYYAVLPSYRLTYNANGGSGAPTSETGTTLTISSTQPTRSDYVFMGWATKSSSGSIEYEAGDSIRLTADTTLYAVWGQTVTLTYDANGGTGAPAAQNYTTAYSGSNLLFSISSTEPTPPSGKAFRGWSTSSSDTTADYKIGASITISSNTTLYAVYVTPLEAGASFTGSDVGAYVTYTPSSTSYTVSTSASGYTSDQTYNPSSYTNWRVFSNDGTDVEIISDEGVEDLTLTGKTGYVNAVQTLQDMSAAYVNSTYAISGRNLGYSEQGLTDIENYKTIDTSVYSISYGVSGFPYEDGQYTTDEAIILNNGSLGHNVYHDVWLASRSISLYDNRINRFIVRRMYGDGSIAYHNLYNANSDGTDFSISRTYKVRPVITLKSGLIVASGDGSPSNPYIITDTLCDHSYTEESTDSAYLRSGATCMDDATYYYKCAYCTDCTTDDWWTDYDSATGHSSDSGTVTIQATCTTEGEVTYVCNECGDTYTEQFGKLEHDTIYTYTVSGHKLSCQNCSYVSEEEKHSFYYGEDCECGMTCFHEEGLASYQINSDTVSFEWDWPSDGEDSITVHLYCSCKPSLPEDDYYTFNGAAEINYEGSTLYSVWITIIYTDSYGGESRWEYFEYL